VDYSSDLTHVERVVGDVGREVMTEVPGGVLEFEPLVRYHTFADSSVNFTVILRAREFVDQYLIKHDSSSGFTPASSGSRLRFRFRFVRLLGASSRLLSHNTNERRAGSLGLPVCAYNPWTGLTTSTGSPYDSFATRRTAASQVARGGADQSPHRARERAGSAPWRVADAPRCTDNSDAI
jgi:hypothetical protein